MKDKDFLRIHQLEDTLRPFRRVARATTPHGGWIKGIREALGMTNVQLAKRAHRVPQTIEDIQKSEANGTIQLNTLRELAQALNCTVVYAVVPAKPLAEMLRQQAEEKARSRLRTIAHSMRLEDQGVSPREEARQLEILVQRLLAGSPKKLWE